MNSNAHLPPFHSPPYVTIQVRAARLGVNVLSMDSDVTFFHDPYPFWKSEPFNK